MIDDMSVYHWLIDWHWNQPTIQWLIIDQDGRTSYLRDSGEEETVALAVRVNCDVNCTCLDCVIETAATSGDECNFDDGRGRHLNWRIQSRIEMWRAWFGWRATLSPQVWSQAPVNHCDDGTWMSLRNPFFQWANFFLIGSLIFHTNDPRTQIIAKGLIVVTSFSARNFTTVENGKVENEKISEGKS